MWIEPLFFELSCTHKHTHRRTHTDTHTQTVHTHTHTDTHSQTDTQTDREYSIVVCSTFTQIFMDLAKIPDFSCNL